jgi:hypothetical protein
MMAVKLLEGIHLTAFDKRALAACHAGGFTGWRTARKSYTLAREGEAWRYSIRWRESDDWGRPVDRVMRGLVTFTGGPAI